MPIAPMPNARKPLPTHKMDDLKKGLASLRLDDESPRSRRGGGWSFRTRMTSHSMTEPETRPLRQGVEGESMATLLQDLRFGARALRKTTGLTSVAVLALALGIGANTAMFSIVNAVLLRPLPYAEPARLLQLYTSMPQFGQASVSYPNFLDWRQRSGSFDLMAAYRSEMFNLTGQATPERLRGQMASADIFPTLGVKPIVGRVFGNDDDRKGGAPVVVLT